MVDATIRRYQRQSQAAASAASGATVTRLEEVKELLADARLRALKRQRKLNDKLTGIEVSVSVCVCKRPPELRRDMLQILTPDSLSLPLSRMKSLQESGRSKRLTRASYLQR